MKKLTNLLAIALIFALASFTAVNAQEVSVGDEYLAPGQGGNDKEFVMPGDNVSITPKNKFGAPEETFLKAKKAFLKAKKAFGINTAKGAFPSDKNFPGSDWVPGRDWSPDSE